MSDNARAEKIAKLLKKAERAATEHEADAFYGKAQELMTLWAIDDAMLAAADPEKSRDFVTTEDIPIKRSGYFKSMQRLFKNVAEANNVKAIFKGTDWGDQAGIRLIGWVTDIERTKMLYTSLLIQCTRERQRGLPEEYRAAGPKYIARWRHSFAMSYAVRVGDRLWQQKERTTKEATQSDGSMLPVLADRSAAVEAEMAKESYTNKRAGNTRYDTSGWEAGYRAAERADVGNTRVGDGPRKQLG